MTAMFVILAIVLTASVVILIIVGIQRAADTWGQPEKRGKGKIIAKHFTEESTYTTFMTVGKVSVPQQNTSPAEYKISVEIEGESDSISVNEGFFERIKEGDSVEVSYVVGKNSGKVYLKNVFSD